jgi:hypothetical protein
MFVSGNPGDKLFLLRYVDGILIAGPLSSVNRIKAEISKKFKYHDLGEPSLLLGMKIVRNRIRFLRSRRCLWLGQSHYSYARELLERFGMLAARPRRTPVDVNISLSKNSRKPNPDILGS